MRGRVHLNRQLNFVLRGLVSFCLTVVVHSALAQESPHGKIRFECSTCHSTDTWKMRNDAGFKHDATGFALTGQHKIVQCTSCHEGLKFANLSSNCLSCHTDIHKSELGTNCLRCHTTQTWKIADLIQNHQSTTRFPLLGRHATLSCQSCHVNASQKQFAGTPTDCFSCHRNDYQRAKAPNHVASGFTTNCVQCHQVTAFKWGSGFQHELTQFPLTGAHVAASCFACHRNQVFKSTPSQCISCHQPDYASTVNPNHGGARFSTECQSCHTTSRWPGAVFNHDQTQFPLVGAHRLQQCSSCHADNVFTGKQSDCISCHRTQFNSALNPNHVAGNFPTQCQTCHNASAWRPATFNHALTQFPLTGAHQAVTCEQCHANGQYTNTPTTCVGCHQTTFNNTTNPNHVAGNFSTNCEQCHTTAAWQPAQFDHNTTAFALTGRHTTTQCQSCHINNNYQLSYSNCFQCHQTHYAQPANPRHTLPSFSYNCTPCHTTTAWTPSTFNHSTTSYPLTGKHVGRQCNECHINDVYQNLPHTCWDCHANDFNTALGPNHVQRNFSHDCTQCHSTSGWGGASFDHATTNFPLTGRHVTTQCEQCHINGNYQLVYTDCYPCHVAQYAQPQNPNHVLGNLDHDCAPCHSTTAWLPSTFNHASTLFPLVGAHQSVSCALCHLNNQYQNLPGTCWDCHATTFNATTNPNHQQGQFNHDCLQCHTQSAWQPATFNHASTNFPLTGAHVVTQCQQCHVNGNYQLQYTNCYPCHTADFAQPQDPNHVVGNFNHDCTSCHSTTAWHPSTFSHANTAFPLVGAHQAVTCNLCHINSQYQLPHTCWDCHATDFGATTNPNHQQGQFSHDCLTCHTQSAWQPATFNHASTNFPLTGAHITTACVSCHVNGNYQLNYTDCYQCHATDFAIPVNPNHVTWQLSHDCTSCHTTTTWLPSTFNHDTQFFRIYSGKHRNKWNNNCTSCHPALGQYQIFTCTTSCHPRAEMDDKHRERPGYIYESAACYDCHRDV